MSELTRRQFGKAACLEILALSIPSVLRGEDAPRSMKMPNVMVLQPDQHRGTIMSCAGDTQIQTPNLDRLAAGGIRFTHCVSNHPVCSPFRASFQTGLYEIDMKKGDEVLLY